MKLTKKHNQECRTIVGYSTKYRIILYCLLLLTCSISCKKLVDIDPPESTITTSQAFLNIDDATRALIGIYSNMALSGTDLNNPTNSALTIMGGMSADELIPFDGADPNLRSLYTNTLLGNNTSAAQTWGQLYPFLYHVNAVLEGVQASALPQSVKDQFSGETKFLRAFINFYLVNLYGDVPLITTTDYKSNALATRTPSAEVYAAIVNDLKDAKSLLPADFSAGGGERIRANKGAASALLARVYLYTKDYANAEAEATSLIGNTAMYTLAGEPDEVFLKDSREAILQWHNNSEDNNDTYNATPEGYVLIPSYLPDYAPFYFLSKELLADFERRDKRSTAWIYTYNWSTDQGGDGLPYSFPYKYKTGPDQYDNSGPIPAEPGGEITEYYMVLRLAEQYLIRAEARAQGGNLPGAIEDLNSIRTRAGLADLSASLGQAQVLAAIAQERRIELFAEWGHRWLDLKRTGKVAEAFSGISYKSSYMPYQNLYPIPQTELEVSPLLKQNPGYF